MRATSLHLLPLRIQRSRSFDEISLGSFLGSGNKGQDILLRDYQGTRQQIARVRTSTVPTVAQRQGNFSSSLGALLFLQPNGSISTTVTANPVNVIDTNGNTILARVELAYAGSKITHVGIPDTNINQLTASQLALGPALLTRVANPFFGQIPRSSSLGDPTIPVAQLLKPFPRFTNVTFYRNNVGNTNYNALQAKLKQRFTHGFSFLVSYTRSKLIDEASSVFDASILTGPIANFPVADSFNRKLERDLSTGDIPNVFVASFTCELPIGKGKRFNPGGITGKILEGFELAGVIQLQSGMPVAVTQVTNFNAFAGFGTQRPNLVADPDLPSSERTTARFFNTSAFTIAPQLRSATAHVTRYVGHSIATRHRADNAHLLRRKPQH